MADLTSNAGMSYLLWFSCVTKEGL